MLKAASALIVVGAISVRLAHAGTSGDFGDGAEVLRPPKSPPVSSPSQPPPVNRPLNMAPDAPTDPRILDEIRRRATGLLSLECKITYKIIRDDGYSTSGSSSALFELDLGGKSWRRLDDDGDTDGGTLVVTENAFILKQDAKLAHSVIEGRESIKIDRVAGKYRRTVGGEGLGWDGRL
jgi:hypothetical protein